MMPFQTTQCRINQLNSSDASVIPDRTCSLLCRDSSRMCDAATRFHLTIDGSAEKKDRSARSLLELRSDLALASLPPPALLFPLGPRLMLRTVSRSRHVTPQAPLLIDVRLWDSPDGALTSVGAPSVVAIERGRLGLRAPSGCSLRHGARHAYPVCTPAPSGP